MLGKKREHGSAPDLAVARVCPPQSLPPPSWIAGAGGVCTGAGRAGQGWSGPGTGSAWCCERAEAGAHVRDELFSDVHEREAEEVVAVVAAVCVAAAPDVVGGAVSASGRGCVRRTADPQGAWANLSRSPQIMTWRLTWSQSGRSSVWRPACLAVFAVVHARIRSNR
jgi:hypothetical protein